MKKFNSIWFYKFLYDMLNGWLIYVVNVVEINLKILIVIFLIKFDLIDLFVWVFKKFVFIMFMYYICILNL